MADGLLEGVRILEVAMFAPDGVGMHLADLGAEIIKVEAPGLGDPARLLGQPFRGEAPATRRWNRGKRSLSLDLRSAEGAGVFRELVGKADAVIEGMRPGSLARRGLGYADLLRDNSRLVFATVSGWGQTGPYRDLASHGLAFDAFAGLAPPRQAAGHIARPAGHVWQGLEAGPLYAALAIVSAIVRARATGQGAEIEVSQADAAATWNGWRIAYEAAIAEETAHPGVDPEGPARLKALEASAEGAGASGDRDFPALDVRYQYYATKDGTILLMATESRFWKNFCAGLDRLDLFERWPGEGHADHDYGNEALRTELATIFAERTRGEWVAFFIEHDVAGAPVYEPGETFRDPHFEARGLWIDADEHALALLGSPVRVDGVLAVSDHAAPSNGADSDAILQDVLGYDANRVRTLRQKGILGDSR